MSDPAEPHAADNTDRLRGRGLDEEPGVARREGVGLISEGEVVEDHTAVRGEDERVTEIGLDRGLVTGSPVIPCRDVRRGNNPTGLLENRGGGRVGAWRVRRVGAGTEPDGDRRVRGRDTIETDPVLAELQTEVGSGREHAQRVLQRRS